MRNSEIDGIFPFGIFYKHHSKPSADCGLRNRRRRQRHIDFAVFQGGEPGRPGTDGNDLHVLLRGIPRLADHKMGEMRRQSRRVRDPDGESLERLELLLQRAGLGDSPGFGRLFVNRPVDEQSVEGARNHHEGFALLMRENHVVSGRKAEIHLPGYQAL